MPPREPAMPPLLRCAQCDAAITAPLTGLYALLDPALPQTGYREMRIVHRCCAVDYEEARGVVITWLPLERIWPGTATNAVTS